MVEPSNEPEPQDVGDLTYIFEKIHDRVDEDNASLHADLCEALAKTDRPQHRRLVEDYIIAWSDVVAHYYRFLVPGLLPIDGYRELLEGIQQHAEKILTQQFRLSLSLNFQLKIKAMVARSNARAMERARTWRPAGEGTGTGQLQGKRTARSLIEEWMKINCLTHDQAAKRLAISETVLYALKRGTAIKEHRCSVDKLSNAAKNIGCQPDELEVDYPH